MNRSVVNVRTAPDTADKLRAMAYELGYIYDGEGATGQLLDAIANGELSLVPAKKPSRKKTGSVEAPSF